MTRQYVHLFFLSPAWLLFLLLFFYFSPAKTHIAGRLGPTFLPLNFCFNEDGEPSNQKQQLALCEPTPRPSWLEEFQNLIFLPSSVIYGFIFLLYLLSNQIEIGLGIEPKTWDSKQNISKYQSAIKPIPPLITPLYYLSLITCYTNNCEYFFWEKLCRIYTNLLIPICCYEYKLTCQQKWNYQRKDHLCVRPKRPTPSIEKNISTTSSQVSVPPTFNHNPLQIFSSIYYQEIMLQHSIFGF